MLKWTPHIWISFIVEYLLVLRDCNYWAFYWGSWCYVNLVHCCEATMITMRFKSLILIYNRSPILLLLWLLNKSKNVKIFIFSQQKADTYSYHKVALKHKSKAPTNVGLQDWDCDSAKDVADHDTNDNERMQNSHPFRVTFSRGKFIDPNWTINNTKGLGEAEHKAHKVQYPYVWGETENKTGDCVSYHIYAKNRACFVFLENHTHKETWYTEPKVHKTSHQCHFLISKF